MRSDAAARPARNGGSLPRPSSKGRPSMPARSYAHGASPVPLLGETIAENLRRTVERFATRPALIARSQGRRFTWGELLDQVRLAARGLLARGVQKGDRVGIWAPNRYEWVVLQYATAQIGAILVNVNPAYKTSELEYVLQQSGASLLVYAKAFRTSDFHGMVEQVRGQCPLLRATINLEGGRDRLLADAARA